MKIEFINKEKTKSFSHAEDPKIQYKFTAFVYAFVETLKLFKCLKNVKEKQKIKSLWLKYMLSTSDWKTEVRWKKKVNSSI